MNQDHRILCASDMWGEMVKDQILPWVLEDIEAEDLGGDVVEVGPGPGRTTDVIRTLTDSVTAVELDVDLAAQLTERFAGTNVDVHQADGTALPFADGRFSAGVCFAMLHHVPTPALQDQLLAELVRVVRPGGRVIGSDSVASADLEALHVDDTYNPIDPDELPDRLAAAGLHDIEVDANEFAFRFRGVAG